MPLFLRALVDRYQRQQVALVDFSFQARNIRAIPSKDIYPGATAP